jgi:coenzyme Q-binding protein COQ10
LFTSRLFCSPNSVVEALSGSATTSLSKDELKHYESSTHSWPVPGQSDVFKTLSTKWTVRPFHYKPPSGRPQTDSATLPPRDQTEVQLAIEFQFANPLYAALSSAVAPKVAGVMIEAFEKRARKLLENSPGAAVRDKRQQEILGGEKVGL